MKQFGLWLVTATAVLSFAALSFAQASPVTPTAAMSGKGEMKGEMKGDMKDEMKGGMTGGAKPSDGMEKKSDTMMMKPSDGMEKKSEGMMEKKK